MSNPNEKDKKLDLIKENFNHARHIENERLQFAQIYGAIVAGSFALSSTGGISIQLYNILLILLYIVGLFGFILTIKLSYEFANHMEKNHQLALTDETINNYLARPLDTGIFKVLKAKYMFFGFYIGISCYLLYLILITYLPQHRYIIILSAIIMIIVVLIAHKEFKKYQNKYSTKQM
jgi:hypothetical protein